VKFLRKKGLENPRIVCQIVTHAKTGIKKKGFKLVCDNYTESKILSKKYSFFEQLFDVFLVEEMDRLFEKLKKIVVLEEGYSETEDAKDIIYSYLEEEFDEYMKSMSAVIDEELEVKVKMPFDFKWKKVSHPLMITIKEEDRKNGILLYCLIPSATENAILKGSRMIETRAINALYKEKIYNVRPNIYYFHIDDVSIEAIRLHKKIKEHLKKGEAVMYIVPTNEERTNSSPKVVYLYKSLFARKKNKGGKD
jgi:hypothetical protein